VRKTPPCLDPARRERRGVCREDRQRDPPADDDAREHREADRQADEVTRADQRERQPARNPGRARPDAEIMRGLGDDDLGLGEDREAHRGDRVDDDQLEPAPAFGLTLAAARADLEHLGGGAAFGIGQVGVDDECAAQRDREHHAEDAAGRGDARGHQIGESLPPADHDETGQDEDDRRQRSRRGGDGLDDIVFEDRRAGQVAQHRHRDDGGRNRCREGQPDLQPEVHVRRGEQQRDQPAENDTADGEFGNGAGGGCGRGGRGGGRRHAATMPDCWRVR